MFILIGAIIGLGIFGFCMSRITPSIDIDIEAPSPYRPDTTAQKEKIRQVFMGVGAGLGLLIVLGSLILNGAVCSIPTSITLPIYSGMNNNEVRGGFLALDTNDTVYFWMKEDNGAFHKHSAPMRLASFVEDNKNVVVVSGYRCPDLDTKVKWWVNFDIVEETYEFHIPEGSIQQLFFYR